MLSFYGLITKILFTKGLFLKNVLKYEVLGCSYLSKKI